MKFGKAITVNISFSEKEQESNKYYSLFNENALNVNYNGLMHQLKMYLKQINF